MLHCDKKLEFTSDTGRDYIVQVDEAGNCTFPKDLLLDAGINGAKDLLFRSVSDEMGHKHLLGRAESAHQTRHARVLEDLTLLAGSDSPSVGFAIYSNDGTLLSRTPVFQSHSKPWLGRIASVVWHLVKNLGQTYECLSLERGEGMEPLSIYAAAIRRRCGDPAFGAVVAVGPQSQVAKMEMAVQCAAMSLYGAEEERV